MEGLGAILTTIDHAQPSGGYKRLIEILKRLSKLMVATVKRYPRDIPRKKTPSDIANRHGLSPPHAFTPCTERKIHGEPRMGDDAHSEAIRKQAHFPQVRGLPKAAIAA